MAEEDEIDILGDFSCDNLLKPENDLAVNTNSNVQNSELLDYIYASPSYLDSTTNSWFPSETLYLLSGNNVTDFQQEKLPSFKTSCMSSWTEKEKALLKNGIEIFGKSNICLAQFIGSKTPSEVKYYLKHFYRENVKEDILNNTCDESINQIPTSMEEVIASVNTAKPTIILNPKQSNCYVKENRKQQNDDSVKSKKGKHFGKTKRHNSKIKQNSVSKSPKKSFVRQDSTHSLGIEFNNSQEVFAKDAIQSFNGEEVIKIQKNNMDLDSDVDVDIDIEHVNEELENSSKEKFNTSSQIKEELCLSNNSEADIDNKSDFSNPVPNSGIQKASPNNYKKDLESVDSELKTMLLSTDIPVKEVYIDKQVISDLEKFVHFEFFEGRPVKTPERYLMIRNYILKVWHSSKPKYITKTLIRQGLKNCGDVNCIGRIHSCLEQIGAINFGCEQTEYVRPLYDYFFSNFNTKEKSLPKTNMESISRQRFKKKFLNDGEGGKTLTHGEKGEIINTTIIEETISPKKVYTKKPLIKLIYCKPFSDNFPQPFRIKIHLHTLLLMDLHAHTCYTEVMGLIGGTWDQSTKSLNIACYEPCRNVAPSATHCDMCPITQAKAADNIHKRNMNVLGWFHTHPTFAPEPSQQDIDTQMTLQQWIGIKGPCIGIILSPYSSPESLIASPFRCMIVDKKLNFEDQFVPYKFKTDLIVGDFNIEIFLKDAQKVFNYDTSERDNKAFFSNEYFLDKSINHKAKFIGSVKMHLSNCKDLSSIIYNSIIEGLLSVIDDNLHL